MVKNFGDIVVDRLHERATNVRNKLKEQFKNTKPFRSSEVSNDELLYYYNQLTPDQMMTLVERHGRDAVNGLIKELETLKARRNQNA